MAAYLLAVLDGPVVDAVVAEKLNWPRWGSVASIFISFSAVTMLNSRLAIVVYAESLSRPEAMAVPK